MGTAKRSNSLYFSLLTGICGEKSSRAPASTAKPFLDILSLAGHWDLGPGKIVTQRKRSV